MVAKGLSDQPHGSPRMPRQSIRILTAVLILAVAVASVAAAIFVFLPGPNSKLPASFGADQFGRVAPGKMGCLNVTGEVCIYLNISSSLQGFPAANLFFAVSNAYSTSYPILNNISLDVHGAVTILNGSTTGGTWNFSMGNWSAAPSGVLPTSSPFEVILDTGLQSNSTLVGASFWVEHPNPDAGALGVPV
jgi:hypothetical protein